MADVRQSFIIKTAGTYCVFIFTQPDVNIFTCCIIIRFIFISYMYFFFIGNYFGIDTINENSVLKSGTEYLNAFLNTSNCCTLYLRSIDLNALEANDSIVSSTINYT